MTEQMLRRSAVALKEQELTTCTVAGYPSTSGVVVGSSFFYMANIQDDKKSAFDPIAILKLGL